MPSRQHEIDRDPSFERGGLAPDLGRRALRPRDSLGRPVGAGQRRDDRAPGGHEGGRCGRGGSGIDPTVEGDDHRRLLEGSRVIESVERHGHRIGAEALGAEQGRSRADPVDGTPDPSRGTWRLRRTQMRDRRAR